MSLGQSLQQRQLQRLSPQQIQLMKLLQLPSAQIEQRVKEELEENPALEVNLELNDYNYDDDGDIADYKTKDDYYPELDDDKVTPIRAEQSLHEQLMDQLSMLDLGEDAFKIAEQIIGSLDDDGYLRRALQSIADDLAFKQGMLVAEKTIENILIKIQGFDPVGIAARNLQECLLLQLKRKLESGGKI